MDGSASIGLEQALLGHSLGFAPFASPTQVYVALCLASTVPSETVPGLEASGGGYARQPATFALIAGPSNVAANTTSIEFPQALSSWGQIGFFELWDAPNGGNRLYWGQLVSTADFTTPLVLQVSAGDITRFSAGTLGVQAATGSGGTASIGAYLPLAGGQMGGELLAWRDPQDLMEVATKSYVDAHSGSGGGPGFLPLSGGTMLGALTLAGGGGTFSAPTAFNAGLSFSGGAGGPGSISTSANWGGMLQGRSGSVADVALQASDGTVALAVGTANTILQRGFLVSSGPATVQAVTGSGQITRLSNLGTTISGSTTFTGTNYKATVGSTLDTLNAPSLTVADFGVVTNLGANWSGSRIGVNVQMNTAGNTDLSTATAGGAGAVVGFGSVVHAAHNMGGVAAGWGSTQFGLGTQWGAVIQTQMVSGATYFASSIGMEIDNVVAAGASTQWNIGLLLTLYPTHAVQGAQLDAAMMISTGSLTKWRNGILLGNTLAHAIDPNGYYIRALTGRDSTIARTAAGGIDLLQPDFTGSGTGGGGFAYRAQGFQVLNGGATQIGPALISFTPGTGASIDCSWQQMSGTPAVASGGSNYTPHDVLEGVDGSLVTVTTVGGGGAITAVSVMRRGWAQTGALPANPVTFTAQGRSGVAIGSGCTLNLTWTPAPALSLQPSGGATTFGGPVSASVIATGGTTARSLQDRFGQVIDIRDLGAACDGVTNDTAAWTAAFAKPDGTVIRIPQNCVTMVGDGAFRAGGSRSVSIIGDGRSSIVRLISGTVLSTDLFVWSGGTTRQVRIENLTIDYNNCPQPAALRQIINLAQVTGARVRNVAVINGSANLYMIGLMSSSDFVVENCYCHVTAATSTVQSKGIITLTALGPNIRGRVVNNICVNTNMNFSGASQVYIAGNDISGWGVGGGITTDPATSYNTIVGNTVHDSLAATDVFGITPSGIESWSSNVILANNKCWNCAGAGIGHGGENGLIVGNTCWDNNTAGIGNAGILAATTTGHSASGSVFIGNYCYDSGVNRQGYGFRVNNTGITNLTLNSNRFSGYQGDVSFGSATFLSNTDYTPRILAGDPTVSLGAATKQYVDARARATRALYQTTATVGNGADTTSDVLQTFTVPANTLLNIGDRLVVRAAGAFTGSTDTKLVTVIWATGGPVFTLSVNTASQQQWRLEGEIIKTASGVQTACFDAATNSNVTAVNSVSVTRADTVAEIINIQAQNSTNPVASSITCRYFTVDYVAAA